MHGIITLSEALGSNKVYQRLVSRVHALEQTLKQEEEKGKKMNAQQNQDMVREPSESELRALAELEREQRERNTTTVQTQEDVGANEDKRPEERVAL